MAERIFRSWIEIIDGHTAAACAMVRENRRRRIWIKDLKRSEPRPAEYELSTFLLIDDHQRKRRSLMCEAAIEKLKAEATARGGLPFARVLV